MMLFDTEKTINRTDELSNIDSYIVPAGLDGQQGIMGALYMAMEQKKH